jgi:hypothetical protein
VGSQSINIAISIDDTAASARHASSGGKIGSMDNVKVIINMGGDIRAYNFSRVPVVGERIKIQDQLYVVRSVTHTPNHGHSAEIEVSLALRNSPTVYPIERGVAALAP